eukprot:CAMPEP_0206504680 /NCGR_PEP_ID=MMETSP0324_2-20121206/55644_1 /ASSEMBLY_ACC=CAM_ASM_000836 /TAXON_ID=2866 /ORGANISM="Crypthecodinium cohnii, Strain Seligo" /LENGTH=50 /DNA_ID=CAMNT_0053993925 /DNA_START=117 /DNA_END=265 /DNA_ORIENTATION=+
MPHLEWAAHCEGGRAPMYRKRILPCEGAWRFDGGGAAVLCGRGVLSAWDL